jgi:hypothetical protein
VRQVHKFSIGKDFASLEIDEDQVLNFSNSSIYSNVPPTLVTKPIQTSKRQHLPLNIEQKASPSPPRLTRSTTSSTSPFVDQKWEKIRRKIKLVNKNTGVNVLNDIISDILIAKEINYVNLTKGRRTQ